jgi:hypothetical protein
MALPREHLLDELATAYLQVLAAAAGATIAVSRLDYGVDGTLKQIVWTEPGRYIESGFPVDFQLKGTTTAKFFEQYILFDLKARNHDLIASRESSAVPYYLFLICFSADPKDWFREELEGIFLRATAFWWTTFAAPSGNTSVVRIQIPMHNRLTAQSIDAILEASKDRFGT